MPTEINGYSPSEETVLSSLVINEVDSTETFEKMKEKGLLQDNQLYLVTDEQASAGIDEVPTEGSKNLVYSGGVYDALKQVGSADSVIEQNKGLEQKFWRGTKEEFEAVETKSDDTMYIITDEEGSSVVGSGVAIGDEEPTDGATVWIDTDAELSSGGGVDIPASDTEPATGNYWLDTSAEGGTYYTAEETLSASTKTALGIAEDATPDVAFAEIGRQLSESGGLKLTQLWENASPTSSFAPQTITVDFTGYAYILIFFYIYSSSKYNGSPVVTKVGESGVMNSGHPDSTASYCGRRDFSTTISTITFTNGLEAKNGNGAGISNSMYVPYLIYGFNL